MSSALSPYIVVGRLPSTPLNQAVIYYDNATSSDAAIDQVTTKIAMKLGFDAIGAIPAASVIENAKLLELQTFHPAFIVLSYIPHSDELVWFVPSANRKATAISQVSSYYHANKIPGVETVACFTVSQMREMRCNCQSMQSALQRQHEASLPTEIEIPTEPSQNHEHAALSP